MVDIPLGSFRGERSPIDERKLIRFPSVTEGKLADAISLLSRPGSPKELGSEDQFRSMYRSMAASWPVSRPRRNRLSMMVGAAAFASLFATATGLSAASVMPAPAEHVVNGILRPLNVAGAPPAVNGTATNHATVTAPSSGSVGGRSGSSAVTATASGAPRVAAGTRPSATATSTCHHKVSCAVRHAAGSSGTTGANTGGAGSSGGSANNPGTAVASGSTGSGSAGSTAAATATADPTTGSVGSGTSGGSGSSTGSGSGRGGNQGAGGGTTGTGRHGKGGHGQGTRHRGHHGPGASATTTTTAAVTGAVPTGAPSSTTSTTAATSPPAGA